MKQLASLHGEEASNAPTKMLLAIAHAGALAAVACLLFGDTPGAQTDSLTSAGSFRRSLLMAAATIYFLRTLLTTFVLLKRRMPGAETIVVATLIGTLQLAFAYFGRQATSACGPLDAMAVLLYLAGSALNSISEFQRHRWKQMPQHASQLYTAGFFRYAMHINYFGDFLLFTGWALLTARWFLLIVPALMLLGFLYVHIPTLDQYLAKRYGHAFQEYAAHTKKLIPFIY